MKEIKIVLPIPVSNNNYLYPKVMGKYARLAETAKSKKWKAEAAKIIKKELKKNNWKTVERGVFLDVTIDYFFNKKGMDPNNYLKTLYDVMESCGVYENDDMCKPQTGIVVIDKFNPRIEVNITKSQQIGAFKNHIHRVNFISEYEFMYNQRKFNSIMKKLDDNRLTEETYYKNDELLMKNIEKTGE